VGTPREGLGGQGRLNACPLCETAGGEPVWRDARLRVVLPAEPDYPGFVRVVWNRHVAEMTDLEPADREHLMSVVWTVERAQREALGPDKVNLASLGNMVAHLHWHVIPRWRDDRNFPAAVWAQPAPGRDEDAARRRAVVLERVPALVDALRRSLAG